MNTAYMTCAFLAGSAGSWSGVRLYDAVGWLGVCAGAGTPQPVIAALNRQIGAVVKSPEYREMIEKAGSVALSSTPEELAKILAETYEQTAAISREFALQLD